MRPSLKTEWVKPFPSAATKVAPSSPAAPAPVPMLLSRLPPTLMRRHHHRSNSHSRRSQRRILRNNIKYRFSTKSRPLHISTRYSSNSYCFPSTTRNSTCSLNNLKPCRLGFIILFFTTSTLTTLQSLCDLCGETDNCPACIFLVALPIKTNASTIHTYYDTLYMRLF